MSTLSLLSSRSRYKVLILVIAGLAGLALNPLMSNGADAPAGGPPPGPMPVKVVLAEESHAQIWSEYSGRLEAVDMVEIRPQVSGTIKEVRFEDGQVVKQGDVLFVIDTSSYEAAVQRAQADVAAAESQQEFALKQLKRAQDLAKTNAISKDLLDERNNAARVSRNTVAAARADLKQAKIDLDYAYVKAPISGRTSRAEITVGNLVQAGPGAPLLTTIVSDSAIYASFDVDEQTYVQRMRSLAKTQHNERSMPVTLTVRGDADQVYQGFIHSFDNQINTASGTVRTRALFKNDDGRLLPGMFASVKMGGVGNEKRVLIPERAVGTDQDRRFVFVVDGANKVVYREVKMGAAQNGKRVVLSGVEPGEKVIVEGMMRVRPDMEVLPQVEQQTAESVVPAPPAAEAIAAPAAEPTLETPAETLAPAQDASEKN